MALLDGGGPTGGHEVSLLFWAKGTPISQQTFLTQEMTQVTQPGVQGPNKELSRGLGTVSIRGAVWGRPSLPGWELTWPGGSLLRVGFQMLKELPAP